MKANKAVPNRRIRIPRVQLLAELERAKTEIALLAEELGIKDTRWSRVPPRRRPRAGEQVPSLCGLSREMAQEHVPHDG